MFSKNKKHYFLYAFPVGIKKAKKYSEKFVTSFYPKIPGVDLYAIKDCVNPEFNLNPWEQLPCKDIINESFICEDERITLVEKEFDGLLFDYPSNELGFDASSNWLANFSAIRFGKFSKFKFFPYFKYI
jgi:hypothetical protein